MPALVEAGYHVIVPNQRGYGNSSRPTEVTDYDIEHLTGDLVALLDHYGYDDATFVGHDWGAMVVWGLTLLHPHRVGKVINLSLPYQERGDIPWIEFLEMILGRFDVTQILGTTVEDWVTAMINHGAWEDLVADE